MKKNLSILSAVLAFAASGAVAEDWPQWLGPRGDSTWNDTGLITKFPAEGPKVVWRAPIANGYSGPSVSGGKVFVMDFQISSGKVDDNPGGRTKVTGKERVVCVDEKTGKPIWDRGWDTTIHLSFPNGPRCMPVVSDGVVYSLGAEGHLTALNAADGKVVWEKELKKDYGSESPIWGFAATPLVHGDLVYTLAGGRGTAVVALDRKSGKEVWRALDTKDVGYAPPVMTKREGKDELLVFLPDSLNGLDPATGKVQWSQPYQAAYGMSIMAPRVTPSGIFVGSMMKKSMMVKPGGGKAEVVWEGKPNQAMSPKNGTPVVVEDLVYGCDMDGDLRCFNSATGERVWSSLEVMNNKKAGSGTFFAARTPQQWVLFNDAGELILADLSASGYKEASRAKILAPETPGMGRKVVWSHPAFANQCVFVRNDKELVCVSLAAK
jgi:outer membrane protein assembly factor BamB